MLGSITKGGDENAASESALDLLLLFEEGRKKRGSVSKRASITPIHIRRFLDDDDLRGERRAGGLLVNWKSS